MTTDGERRSALRQMRILAVSLLAFAAVVYVLTRNDSGFLGYVNAGAEAAMVGAIADWFAVTALFKHPLGVPIPHTALIPRRKDEMARSLQDFVTENFLRGDIVRERLLTASPAQKVADWLAEPANTRRASAEICLIVRRAVGRVTDEHISSLVTEALVPRLKDEPLAPLLGSLLAQALKDDLQRPIVDLLLTELSDWLMENPETVAEVLAERAPWWSPQAVNEMITGRLHTELVKWVADIREDPGHRARAALDGLLATLADNLSNDPATQERTERLKVRLLDDPVVVRTAVSIWGALRAALVASLDEPDGAVQQRVTQELAALAQRLRDEPEARARVDGVVADAAVFVVERYGNEVTSVITHTIQSWDGHEAAARIELHVGRDLQFIRINGTLVGGLVGVLIHAASAIL
jgi:uncharacterized membrane-anchored protein YjiN (DUF445 family)